MNVIDRQPSLQVFRVQATKSRTGRRLWKSGANTRLAGRHGQQAGQLVGIRTWLILTRLEYYADISTECFRSTIIMPCCSLLRLRSWPVRPFGPNCHCLMMVSLNWNVLAMPPLRSFRLSALQRSVAPLSSESSLRSLALFLTVLCTDLTQLVRTLPPLTRTSAPHDPVYLDLSTKFATHLRLSRHLRPSVHSGCYRQCQTSGHGFRQY